MGSLFREPSKRACRVLCDPPLSRRRGRFLSTRDEHPVNRASYQIVCHTAPIQLSSLHVLVIFIPLPRVVIYDNPNAVSVVADWSMVRLASKLSSDRRGWIPPG